MTRQLSNRSRFLCVAVFMAATMPALPASAQVEFRSRATEVTITGRVHTQFNTTSVDGEPGSEFLIRRTRLTTEVRINDLVSGKVQPDFGEGGINLKDAYLRLTFSPAFRATIGQFKRPFDIFELTSSTQILVIERAGGVRGVGTCSGPGGVCSLSRFTEKLQYSDRDIGFQIDGSNPSGRFRYTASITNGTGANTDDENGAKSYTGRVTYGIGDKVRLGGNVALHDYVDPVSTNNEYATAFGADLEYGDFSEGLHVQAGVVAGDNWRNMAAGAPTTFVALQGIATYKTSISDNPYISHIEPVLRLGWGDPNSSAANDNGLLLTPGFVAHFTGRNKIAVNVDIWSPQAGGTEWALRFQSYLHF